MSMSGSYLLDTNIIIGLFADEEAIKSNFAQADAVFIPSIVAGELYYGARKSAQTTKNLERIDELVAESAVLVCDVETAQYYGEVKNKLRLKGRATAAGKRYLDCRACPSIQSDFSDTRCSFSRD